MVNQNLLKNEVVESREINVIKKMEIERDLDYKHRLLKNYLVYANHTGDCSYLTALNETEINETEQEEINEINEEEKELFPESQDSIDEVCHLMTNLLKEIAKQELERINNQSTRAMLEDMYNDLTNNNFNSDLVSQLNNQHHRLGRIISKLVTIGKKYQQKEEAIAKAVKDLIYYHQYIKKYAQPTRIESDLTYVTNDKLYLRRLNNYLASTITTAHSLVNAVEMIVKPPVDEETVP